MSSDKRSTERNDQHAAENLVDPGPLAGVNEEDARASREALRKSTPKRLQR